MIKITEAREVSLSGRIMGGGMLKQRKIWDRHYEMGSGRVDEPQEVMWEAMVRDEDFMRDGLGLRLCDYARKLLRKCIDDCGLLYVKFAPHSNGSQSWRFESLLRLDLDRHRDLDHHKEPELRRNNTTSGYWK
ncbi:hypothetical protein BTUL_0100g00230 [Botrytis tulipae]|uniref:Uncharacterized protein n=1 Tax=Botrytis tulipae TaxID=87230 RepID=A0A4Z1EHG9_9HELO|nr:hypothetical protein BTUL_0100g00230 [Botrytis tulipae]